MKKSILAWEWKMNANKTKNKEKDIAEKKTSSTKRIKTNKTNSLLSNIFVINLKHFTKKLKMNDEWLKWKWMNI